MNDVKEDARRLAIKNAQNAQNESESRGASMSLIHIDTLRFYADIERLIECINIIIVIDIDDININCNYIKNKINRIELFEFFSREQLELVSELAAQVKKNIEIARTRSVLALMRDNFNLSVVLNAAIEHRMSVELVEAVINEHIETIRSEL